MNLKLLSSILVWTLCPTVATHSQIANDPFAEDVDDDQAPRIIRVRVEFIELAQDQYTEIMEGHHGSMDNSPLRATCAELIEKGQGSMIETMSVLAQPGQSARYENASEFVYPTEYEPPSFVNGSDSQQPPTSVVGAPPPPPVAFDVKTVGSTLEVEAQISNDSALVELRLTPNVTYHVADDTWATWTNEDVTVPTSTPRFYVLELKTGLTLPVGKPHLAAAVSPKSDEGFVDHSRTVMTFVRADIIILKN